MTAAFIGGREQLFPRGGGGGEHSKNTRVKLDPKRVHWGQTRFRVNDDPEISQPDAEYDPELGQSDPIICQVCGKLTDFRVLLDQEWSLAPMDPFRVKFDPGVFKVGSGMDLEPPENNSLYYYYIPYTGRYTCDHTLLLTF